jgi:hypothetical protein
MDSAASPAASESNVSSALERVRDGSITKQGEIEQWLCSPEPWPKGQPHANLLRSMKVFAPCEDRLQMCIMLSSYPVGSELMVGECGGAQAARHVLLRMLIVWVG